MHPQLEESPYLKEAPSTLLIVPQFKHLHFQYTLCFFLRVLSLSITYQLSKVFPVKSINYRYVVNSLARQPQLCLLPDFKVFVFEVVILPQSHLHFHILCYF